MKINLKPNKILVQEIYNGAGTWNIAKVLQVSDYIAKIKVGDIVVVSDLDILDFSIHDEKFGIINPENIVATIDDFVE